jgi:predicted DCC family thiol-disulfide oxidoreductase YuxK
VSDLTLLYDADCGFCRWVVDKILAWDRRRRLRPVPLQSEEAGALLPGMAEHERLASWHLVVDGRVYSGGAVAPPLLRHLPGGWPLAQVLALFPGLTERAYRSAARNRDRFGRLAGARCNVDPTARRDSSSPGGEY